MKWRGALLVFAQASSSGGNFLLSVLVARATNINDFAAFALAFPLYALTAQFVRVAYLVPRQVRFALGEGEASTLEPFVPAVRTSSMLVGAGALVWLSVGGTIGAWVFAVTAAAFPAIVYEVMRNEFIVRLLDRRVAAFDATWLVAQVALSVVLQLLGWSSGTAMLIAWAVPPALLAPIMWLRLQRPALTSRTPQQENRISGVDGFVDLLGSVVVLQAIPYLVLALAGTGAAAGFRAGQMLLGPANILVTGLAPVLQRSIAQHRHDEARAKRLVVRHSVFLLALSLPYACIFVAISDDVGRFLLGETWYFAAPMMAGLAALMVARIPFGCITIALRSLQAHAILTRQRLVAYVLLLLGALVGSTAPQPAFIPLAMAAAAALAALLGWVAFVRTLGRTSAMAIAGVR